MPSWVQQWKVFSGKADMVLLITDPGDEYIYFGGLLPYYAAQGKEIMLCVAVNTNSAYKCELLDGLWHCGITNYPYIAYFKPNLCRSLRAQYDTWSEVQFVRHVSRIVRIYNTAKIFAHSVIAVKASVCAVVPRLNAISLRNRHCAEIVQVGITVLFSLFQRVTNLCVTH